MRKLSVFPEKMLAPAQIPLSTVMWFPISPFSVWISRAAPREISGLVVSGDEDDVRRRGQHVPTALPSGNYGKPRLSKEAILDGPCTSVSLFLSLVPLSFLHPRVVFFHPPLSPLSLFDSLAFAWRELLGTIATEFEHKHRAPSNLSSLMIPRPSQMIYSLKGVACKISYIVTSNNVSFR